jgi:hypothetical protein
METQVVEWLRQEDRLVLCSPYAAYDDSTRRAAYWDCWSQHRGGLPPALHISQDEGTVYIVGHEYGWSGYLTEERTWFMASGVFSGVLGPLRRAYLTWIFEFLTGRLSMSVSHLRQKLAVNPETLKRE